MTQVRRCAIYTRKSGPAPFGQEVTSLEAQRAICSAYVASQAHRGWVEVGKTYDDPEESGATLDRPALQELLKDVEAGLVDVVLAYKMDRVTRTLLHFIRLIDFFDRFGVAFVSITQNFDSSDSMGRLVRNILLTFAEFEREIFRDRVRDKKLFLRKNGRWTGGPAPIGYDLRESRLVINEQEAPVVRRMFEVYIETQRPERVHQILAADRMKSNTRTSKSGRVRGGSAPSTSAIYHMLRNPVYVGELSHLGERYQGIHDPIVSRDLWDRAQHVLEERTRAARKPIEHVLSGLIRDSYGRRMYAVRPISGRGYRSKGVMACERNSIKILRVNADRAEQIVLSAIQDLFIDPVALRSMLLAGGTISSELASLCNAGPAAAKRFGALPADEALRTNKLIISHIEVGFDRVCIYLRFVAVSAYLRWDGVGLFELDEFEITRAKRLHLLEVPVELYPRQFANWLAVRPTTVKGSPHQGLIKLLNDAAEAQT